MGNPEVIPSIDDNRKITASAVYVNENKVIVGDKALDYIVKEPNKVIVQTKREMENNMVYSINEGVWKTDDGVETEIYTPAQISSLILKKLKDYTSDVKRAVITVPAMFAESARQATLDAAKLADIEVIELINEPTAAVLHYASLPGVEVGGRVMIYDLGGGTFDVTIAEVKNKKVDVITSRGDKYLGVKDFDLEITKLMNKKYKEKFNSELDLKNNKEYKINSTEKTILEAMINSPGRSFSREEIGKIINLDKERSVDVIITRLRKKIEQNPKNPKYLQTLRGEGYVLWIE